MPECVITQAQDYNEVLKLLQEEVFDLLLLDINMPGGNNIRVVKEILEIQESIKILIFSSYDESLYALRYIEAGAAGFVNKSTAMAELSNAILTIRERGKYMSDEVKDLYVKKLTQSKSKLNTMNPLSRLSNREVDVAKYLIQGHGIIEISTTLDLSPSTVSTYKSRIFEKLNVSNIPELIEIFRIHSAN